MSRSKQFSFLLIFFIAGIGIAPWISWFKVFFLCSLFLVFLFGLSPGTLHRLFFFFLASAAFLSGVARYYAELPNVSAHHLISYRHETLTFSAIVDEPPERRIRFQRLTLARIILEEASNSDSKIVGRVLVTTSLYPEYNYGDRLRVSCRLEVPSPLEDFSYEEYLASQGIFAVCFYPRIFLIASHQGFWWKHVMFSSRAQMLTALSETLPEPQASFLSALLLGDRSGMEPQTKEYFRKTGTSHIMALSGYNITILFIALGSMLPWLGISRKQGIIVLLSAIAFFVFMTGASASLLRAGIMGGLVIIASHLGRRSSAGMLLLLSASVMLLLNPLWLVSDVGFQLSFAATAGLLFLSPLLLPFLSFVPQRFGMREQLSATLSAIVATAPLILWRFQEWSAMSLVSNLLILPFIPCAMFFGFIGIGLGMIHPLLGQGVQMITWFLLEYILSVVEFLYSV